LEQKTSKLKKQIVIKVSELVDCIERLDKQDYFEISMKHVNGELISKTEFSEKDKLK
jgi:hypothetical protein